MVGRLPGVHQPHLPLPLHLGDVDENVCDVILGEAIFAFCVQRNKASFLLQGYMVSLFNRFDFFVVCSSILEYTLVKFEVNFSRKAKIPKNLHFLPGCAPCGSFSDEVHPSLESLQGYKVSGNR